MKATWARVLSDECDLRMRPSAREELVGTVVRGDIVWVQDRRSLRDGTWTHVRFAGGQRGWADPRAHFSRMPTRYATGRPIALRVAPSADAEVVREIRQGAEVRVFGVRATERGPWVYLVLPSGNGGWVEGGTTLTIYGGTLGEMFSGVCLIVIGVCFVISLAQSRLLSNFPFALIGIGIGMIVHGWRVRADATAATTPALAEQTRVPPSRPRVIPSAPKAAPSDRARDRYALDARSPRPSEHVVPAAPRPPLTREPMLLLALGLGLFGVWQLASGLVGYREAAAFEVPPTSISCARLVAEGFGSARRVVITDFLVCDPPHADPAEEALERHSSGTAAPDRHWFAIVPFGDPVPKEFVRRWKRGVSVLMPPPLVGAVLVRPALPAGHSLAWTMPVRIRADGSSPPNEPLEVEVVSGPQDLPTSEAAELRNAFLGIDVAACPLVRAPRQRPRSQDFLLGIGFAAASILGALGIGWNLRRLRAKRDDA